MATVPVFDKRDQQIGIIAAIVFLGLLLLLLLFVTFKKADPPPPPLREIAFTELKEFELKNFEVENGGETEGEASDAPVTDPAPTVEKTLTKKDNPDTEVPTGEGKTTNSNNTQNTSSNANQVANPFATGGSSDQGAGEGKFGNDQGNKGGSGTGGYGDGSGRKRECGVNSDNIESNQDATIYLRLTINSEGKVVDAKNIPSKSSTTDQTIIRQVIAAVKRDVCYNKKPGARQEIKEEPIFIRAS